MQVKIGTALQMPRARTLQEAASEIQRELDVRKRCFERWVTDGKVSEIDAIDRYERMHTGLAVIKEFIIRTQDQEVESDYRIIAAASAAVPLPTSASGG